MRNSILQDALAVSLESAAEAENQEINPVTSETIVEIDELLEEVREGAASVDEHDEAVEELTDAADSLESLISSLESFIADGGMAPQTADMHARALQIATRKLPVNAADFTVSTESFGGTGDKLTASMEALDNVKALLGKIWDAVRSAVEGAWNAAKDFYAAIGKSGPAVVAAGQSLKKRAQAVKDAKSFKVAGGLSRAHAQYLVVGDKIAPAEALKAIVHGFDVGVRQYTGNVVKAVSPLLDTVRKGDITPRSLQSVGDSIKIDGVLADDMKGKLPGGYWFDLTVGGGSGLDMLAASSLKLSQDKTAMKDSYDLDLPSVAEISAMADGIIQIGKSMTEVRKVQGLIEKGVKDVVAAGNAVVAKSNGLQKSEVAQAKAALAKMNKVARLTAGCTHQYMSFMGGAAKAAAAFGTMVIKGYAKGEQGKPNVEPNDADTKALPNPA